MVTAISAAIQTGLLEVPKSDEKKRKVERVDLVDSTISFSCQHDS